jgi:hypothetical protein
MSRFYLSGSNSRGNEVTAMGRNSGQYCHIRGWHSGIRVVARPMGDADAFDVFLTAGSNGTAPSRMLGTLIDGEWFAMPQLETE